MPPKLVRVESPKLRWTDRAGCGMGFQVVVRRRACNCGLRAAGCGQAWDWR